jgi:translocator assembly and maintenance protein 41
MKKITVADLEGILGSFRAPIRFAFGYGSGVYQQLDNNDNVQIDLIFGVTHPEHWHSLNLRQNRHHYSAMGSLGEWTVSKAQKSFGAYLYYNTNVKINGFDVKYGVIAMDQLLKDMNEWETLYISGRMHKPVSFI